MKNTKEDALFAWLTEENNPAVTYRTKTEILREKSDACDAGKYVFGKSASPKQI